MIQLPTEQKNTRSFPTFEFGNDLFSLLRILILLLRRFRFPLRQVGFPLGQHLSAWALFFLVGKIFFPLRQVDFPLGQQPFRSGNNLSCGEKPLSTPARVCEGVKEDASGTNFVYLPQSCSVRFRLRSLSLSLFPCSSTPARYVPLCPSLLPHTAAGKFYHPHQTAQAVVYSVSVPFAQRAGR